MTYQDRRLTLPGCKAVVWLDTMPYHVQLTRCQAVYTAVVRGRVAPRELPTFVPAACGEVWSFIRSAGLPKPGRHIAVYLDGSGSVEVGAEVGERFVGNERIHCSQLPACPVATTAHFGPYQGLSQAHAEIRRWCAQRSQRLAGICWEIYGHWDESWNADSSKIRTDVFYLLDDAGASIDERANIVHA